MLDDDHWLSSYNTQIKTYLISLHPQLELPTKTPLT